MMRAVAGSNAWYFAAPDAAIDPASAAIVDISAPGSAVANEGGADGDGGLLMSSVKKKRRMKMNKHKRRKRRKLNRLKKRKVQ